MDIDTQKRIRLLVIVECEQIVSDLIQLIYAPAVIVSASQYPFLAMNTNLLCPTDNECL